VPTTFLRAAFYWENFIFFGMGPKRGDEGTLVRMDAGAGWPSAFASVAG
jgi:hypothetical protein